MMGGGMSARKMYKAGSSNPKAMMSAKQKIEKTFKPKKNLKKVDSKKNPGLAKLPTKVRNKMGFMKKGGAVK